MGWRRNPRIFKFELNLLSHLSHIPDRSFCSCLHKIAFFVFTYSCAVGHSALPHSLLIPLADRAEEEMQCLGGSTRWTAVSVALVPCDTASTLRGDVL